MIHATPARQLWRCTLILLSAVVLAAHGAPCSAWEAFYDGSVLPTDPVLYPAMWRLLPPSTCQDPASFAASEGLLSVDTSQPRQGDALFTPWHAVSADGSLTVEARVRVGGVIAPPGPLSTYGIFLQAAWGPGLVGIFADEIRIRTDDISYISHKLDMTEFHTLRIAVNGPSVRHLSIGVDGMEVFSTSLSGSAENTLVFGNRCYGNGYGYGDSYWDYVAYSNAYLPVPEPSSLLALTGGVGMLAGLMRRRKT